MTTLNASTVAELKTALASASSGDTILLAPGDYANLSIRSFVGNVTITSADLNNEAVITNMTVQSSSGVTFKNLEFDRSSSGDSYAYRVEDSQNIHFVGLDVHGSLDGNASNDGSGFLIRNTSNVDVVDSEFRELAHAVVHSGDTNLTFTGNEFHELRADGIMGSGSAHVLVSNNRFHDFHPTATDHPDAIQFWSDVGMATPIDIVITNNVIERGDGGSIQGIFMSSTYGPKFTDLVITGNQVGGGMGNGIALWGGLHVTISDNYVKSLDIKSTIRVEDSTDISVTNNKAGAYIYDNDVDLFQSGNSTVAAGGDTGTGNDTSIGGTVGGGGGGGPGADSLTGTAGGDTLDGGAGADTISGQDGSDSLGGGDGNDLLIGGGGNDSVDGGAGIDTVSYVGVNESVNVDLTLKVGQYTGAGGTDRIVNVENIIGGGFRDSLKGDAAANDLRGGGGSDKLIGGGGADSLHGDAGGDTYVYNSLSDSTVAAGGRDQFLDFRHSEGDHIDLRAIDAKAGGSDNAFLLVTKFTMAAGQLLVSLDGDHYTVSGDVTGDGVADFAISVFSTTKPVAGDFFL